jgi:hypothetical protein
VFTWTDDNYTASGTSNLGTVYSQLGATGVGNANNGSSGLTSAGALGVYYAFIQFAGFTSSIFYARALTSLGLPIRAYLGSEIRKSSLDQTQNDRKNHRGRYPEH